MSEALHVRGSARLDRQDCAAIEARGADVPTSGSEKRESFRLR